MKRLTAYLLIFALCFAGAALAEGSLPPYAYTGSDPVGAAVTEYLVRLGQERFLPEEGVVTIPAPVLLRTEETDGEHLRVWGNFWIFNYALEGTTLECVSGGELPGIMTLEKAGDGWTVTALEEAGDGEDYDADIRRFCAGDEELLERFQSASDGDGLAVRTVRHRSILDYVAAGGLDVTAYHDYGWDPIPLAAAEHKTITALAVAVDPDNLVSVAVNARITGYSPEEKTLTLELIVPEIFDREEVLGLTVGDAIYTQGREVVIGTLTENAGYLVINEGEYEFSEGSVWLYEDADCNYRIADWHDSTWNVLATVTVPVRDSLLLLDGIDPSDSGPQDLPSVHSAEEFLAMLSEENGAYGPGFAVNNVWVAFDGDGELAVAMRYYVP